MIIVLLLWFSFRLVGINGKMTMMLLTKPLGLSWLICTGLESILKDRGRRVHLLGILSQEWVARI